jgi:hypothetical protein
MKKKKKRKKKNLHPTMQPDQCKLIDPHTDERNIGQTLPVDQLPELQLTWME